jgi:phospholipid/cholesterol/gamma-HCH transport system substrate-binding protein
MLLNDKQIADNIQTTIQNLKAASKKLDDDLEALQHNFL